MLSKFSTELGSGVWHYQGLNHRVLRWSDGGASYFESGCYSLTLHSPPNRHTQPTLRQAPLTCLVCLLYD